MTTSEQQARVRRLVAALRSEQWQQAHQVLARIIRRDVITDEVSEVHYCCLGVACEVAIADGLELPKQTGSPSGTVFYGAEGDFSNNVLPLQVSNWYGFGGDENPSLKVPDDICGEISDRLFNKRRDGDVVCAAELNDEHRLDFAQIADCFEYTFLPDDWEVTRAAR